MPCAVSPDPAGSRADPPRATVLEVVGGVYRILLDDETSLEAVLRGRIRLDRDGMGAGRIVAGDRVELSVDPSGSVRIERLLPRHSELTRWTGRKNAPRRPVAANVDHAAVVLSTRRPDLVPEQVDRLLALPLVCGIPTSIILNKVDLDPDGSVLREMDRRLTGSGIAILPTSPRTGMGMDALRKHLEGMRTVFFGPSGVGKSSLLNELVPEGRLRTGAVSERAGSGRHTTVSARVLVAAPGCQLIDTPGFGEAGLAGIDPLTLSSAFPEWEPLARGCRFSPCSHRHEPGCGVLAALERGAIDRSRHRSWLRILSEGEELRS